MRINKFVAFATGMSRRAADTAIQQGSVTVNGAIPTPGQEVSESDTVKHGATVLSTPSATTLLVLNKPAGFVVSRAQQGSRTIYDLLPEQYHRLKPIGRLDKDSSGLLLLTDNGALANELTHPKFEKPKVYIAGLNKPLLPEDKQAIETGIPVEDYISTMQLQGNGARWQVTLHQGKNRQIRKTFEAKGYTVTNLHRITFGEYTLDSLRVGHYRIVTDAA